MWSLAVVLALASVNSYSFARLAAVNTALSAWPRSSSSAASATTAAPRGMTTWCLIPIAIVALGAWLYFPPSEYIIGGKDPGTYINEGVQIAQRGSLVIHDADVAAVPARFRGLFFPSYHSASYYSLRFMGFFVEIPDGGQVVGQFPQLYPASIAIGYAIGRSDRRTRHDRRVGDPRTAGRVLCRRADLRPRRGLRRALACSRSTSSRSGSRAIRTANWRPQTLLFAALLAFARTAKDGRGFFGAIAGALLGLGLFLRYEVLIATFTICVAAILAPVARRKVGVVFPVVLAIDERGSASGT